MHWSQALRPLHPGASAQDAHPRASTLEPVPSGPSGPSGPPGPPARRAASICIASGKGGTGKSVVTASLAQLLAGRGRTLLVDADMGVGNAHLLQNVSPRRSFVDVVAGRCEVGEAVLACSERLHLVSAGSGVSRMAGLSAYELHLIGGGLEAIEQGYDFLLVDSAAGISDQTVGFAAACDLVLVVTTPDLTAVTDAYAFIKVLHQRQPRQVPLLVVNRVDQEAPADPRESEQTGARVAERIGSVCQRFLDMEPRWVGTIPEDRSVVKSIAARRPVVLFDPACPASVALAALAGPLAAELARIEPRGMGLSLRHDAAYAS
jgi:flagellar biosynthesis protein FlhG